MVGQNALVIHKHPQVVMVIGFDPLQPPCKMKVIDAAVWYICRVTGDHLILMVNQAIYVPEVDHCLLCPMQCKINGVEINKVPKILLPNPITSTHSILIANPADVANLYTILLQLERVVSYFEYALPTSAKFEDAEIPHLELTAESLACNPMTRTLLFWRRATLIAGDILSQLRGVMAPAEGLRWGCTWLMSFADRNPTGN